MALDNGTMAVTEEVVSVVLVDCTLDVIPLLSHVELASEMDYGFSEVSPQALPSPDPLFAEALHWVSSTSGRMNFYSAESEAEVVSPKPRKPTRQARKPGEGEATTTGKEAPRQKRPTLATVSASLESLMSAIPQLTSQIQHVAERQEKFEVKMMETQFGPKSQLGEPLGAAFAPTTAGPSLGVIAKDLAPPPRTTAQPPLGLLGPLMNVEKPKTVQESEEEKGGRELPDQSNLARAVLAQSHALTTLVSQIAAAGQDPMTDLSTPGAGTSTRGAQGRARLQSELAMHPRHLLHLGLASYVEEDGTNQQLRDDAGSDDGPWNLRHKIPREVWRLRPSPGMGTAAIPGYDGSGLFDGGQHPGGEGHDHSPCCHNRARGFGSWKVGDCKPAMPSRRRAGRSLHDKTSKGFVKEPFVCPVADQKRTGLYERDGRDHFKALGVCAGPKAFYSRSRRAGSQEAAKRASKKKGGKGQTKGELLYFHTRDACCP